MAVGVSSIRKSGSLFFGGRKFSDLVNDWYPERADRFPLTRRGEGRVARYLKAFPQMTLVEGDKIKKYMLILFYLQINQQNIASVFHRFNLKEELCTWMHDFVISQRSK